MLRLTPVIFCLLPALAHAQCPTAADLETGIRFEISGGESEVFQNFTNTALQSIYYIGDDPSSRVLLARGLYLLEVMDFDADGQLDTATRTTYSYSVAPGDLPLPTPGGSFAAKPVLSENGEVAQEQDFYSFGPLTTVSFGACSYDAMEIEIRYLSEDSQERDILMWLPELGISYLTRSIYDGGDDRYYYLSIGLAE